jgi:hypothetical protein
MAREAQYPGYCQGCRSRFPAGESIHWEKGADGKGRSWHLRCAPAGASQVVVPARAAQPQQLQLTSVSQWQRHVGGLTRPTCSGCEDGCWGCDDSPEAMDAWN